MNEINEFSIPLLFKILLIFLALNIVSNFVMYKITDRKIYKQLFLYWFSLVLIFFVEGIFQKGFLQITLAHAANFLPMCLLASFVFKTYSLKLPLNKCSFYFSLSIALTFYFSELNFKFFYIALPTSISIVIPLFLAANLVFRNWRNSTQFQRLVGTIMVMMPIHSLNFALFRLDEGAQLWGWFISWSIYQVLAVILPSFALEEVTRNENVRIQTYTKNLQTEIALLKNKITELDQKSINGMFQKSAIERHNDQFPLS